MLAFVCCCHYCFSLFTIFVTAGMLEQCALLGGDSNCGFCEWILHMLPFVSFMFFSISTHHVLNMSFAVFVLFASKCEHILVWFFQNSIIATAPKICHMGLTPKMGWEWTDDVSCFIGLGNICSRHILYLCMELYFGLWVLKVTLSRCDLEVCLQHIFESSLGCGLAVVQYAFRVCCW